MSDQVFSAEPQPEEAPMSDASEAPVSEGESTSRKRGGGAQSVSGRLRCRANSLREGLRSKVVFSEDTTKKILETTSMLTEAFKPQTFYEHAQVGAMAVARAKLDHCGKLILEDVDRRLDRVLNFWDDDLKTAAIKLSTRLAKDPARVANALVKTKQGAELCIEYWLELASVLENQGDWDDKQRRLVFDLLGIRIELRAGSRRVPPVGDKAGLAALAAREIARLRQLKADVLDDLDVANQEYAVAGLPIALDETSKGLRRDEKRLGREYDKAHAELLRAQAERVVLAQEERRRATEELLQGQRLDEVVDSGGDGIAAVKTTAPEVTVPTRSPDPRTAAPDSEDQGAAFASVAAAMVEAMAITSGEDEDDDESDILSEPASLDERIAIAAASITMPSAQRGEPPRAKGTRKSGSARRFRKRHTRQLDFNDAIES